MIGLKRLDNLQSCIETVMETVPSDFIETGVWRGGACIFMRAVLAAYAISDRKVYICGFDDYALRGCKQAVDDFRSNHAIREDTKNIDSTGIYCRKD